MNVSLTFPLIFLHLFIIRYFALCQKVYETITLTKDRKRVSGDIQWTQNCCLFFNQHFWDVTVIMIKKQLPVNKNNNNCLPCAVLKILPSVIVETSHARSPLRPRAIFSGTARGKQLLLFKSYKKGAIRKLQIASWFWQTIESIK